MMKPTRDPMMMLARLSMAMSSFGYAHTVVHGTSGKKSKYAHKPLSDDLQAEKIRKADDKRKRKAKDKQ